MRAMLLAALATMSFCTVSARAQNADDQTALRGLTEVKIVFDLTNGDAKGLNGTLTVIDETRRSLLKQGVRPQIVLAFRGPATKLVQTDQSLIKAEDRASAAEVAKAIKALSASEGVTSIEQCGIAVRNNEVKPENMVAGVKVVGNGWISLAAYQAKGYSYIVP